MQQPSMARSPRQQDRPCSLEGQDGIFPSVNQRDISQSLAFLCSVYVEEFFTENLSRSLLSMSSILKKIQWLVSHDLEEAMRASIFESEIIGGKLQMSKNESSSFPCDLFFVCLCTSNNLSVSFRDWCQLSWICM